MLAIRIAHILNARGIDNHFTFLTTSGFTNFTAHNLLNSKTKSFRLDHIERLCRVLVCDPNDLVSFYPDNKYPLPSNHPLNNLIKNETQNKDIKNSLRTLPYKELMKISAHIEDAKTPKTQKPDTSAELS
ncbi:helix-turn-helix domain-containing protein [Subsaxibacter sp. CAU 1640]|uniref:helix-turn-helix domain-containing protein n=1 Tax=Subsaxibacter sp. CAU 1640 TaxID=2933271 RepID=UPI0020036996|nr:helix-turn-helix domain-containing protein [Subsaxibacter sp. CAU 1640]MCK7591662.1 helix-turn-helix domain-containing protein [Subsaxibacter sp. CAU 1640]